MQKKKQKKEIEMPNKDGTGPNGKGAKTGRGKGTCKAPKPTKKK